MHFFPIIGTSFIDTLLHYTFRQTRYYATDWYIHVIQRYQHITPNSVCLPRKLNLIFFQKKKERKKIHILICCCLETISEKNYIKLLAYCPGFSKYIALFSCCSCSKVFRGLKQDKSTPKQFCRSAIQTEPQGSRAKVETSLHAFKRLQEKARFCVFFTP